VLIQNLLDVDKLQEFVNRGYINVRRHPALPISIYNYADPVRVVQNRTPEGFAEFWSHHEICQCRGLIVDDDGVVVSRGQYKFFNLGQQTTYSDFVSSDEWEGKRLYHGLSIDADLSFMHLQARQHGNMTITRKMDGQMGLLWNYDGQWGIATRGAFESEGAQFASEKWQKFVRYQATEFVPEGWTLIFEIIAKHLRIVVPYSWEGICLLTAVNNETGEEMSYECLHDVWEAINQYAKENDGNGNLVPGRPWCRIVEKCDIGIEDAMQDNDKKEEGYVVSVNREGLPPVKAKVKLSEYLRLHKLMTNLTPQMLWEELALPMAPFINNRSTYDHKQKKNVDAMLVPEGFRKWVQGWQNGLTSAFHEKLVRAMGAKAFMDAQPILMKERCRNDKERRELLTGMYDAEIARYAMLLYKGDITGAYQAIWGSVRPMGTDETFYVEGQGE
jgi:RNA ligase